jgi:hypothetical protein
MNTGKRPQDADQLRERVREGYARIAERGSGCCSEQVGRKIGYTDAELAAVPQGANLGLGARERAQGRSRQRRVPQGGDRGAAR